VRAVDSVNAARDALATRVPNLVISDIGLPGEDGYAFVKHLRAHEPAAKVPAIAVTAFARSEDRQNVLAAGFDEHLAKPVDADQLVSLVVQFLHR
jgi:CheY-like chemotaxis protein